jgi:phytanoyl-CoA hydroxylase
MCGHAESVWRVSENNRADLRKPGTKILDVHAYSEAAQRICFSDPLREFLERLFGETPLAFQTLHFEVGSTQAVHNDTAYVVVNEPKSLAASWVALEDIQEDSGELVYYPGSHRFEDYLYKPHRKHFVGAEDDNAKHDRHLSWIKEKAAENGIKLESFRPKKGDALFWHADLCHGGGPIKDSTRTRRSLVTHYCPARCTPNYFRYVSRVEEQVKRKSPAGGYISAAFGKFEPAEAANVSIAPAPEPVEAAGVSGTPASSITATSNSLLQRLFGRTSAAA